MDFLFMAAHVLFRQKTTPKGDRERMYIKLRITLNSRNHCFTEKERKKSQGVVPRLLLKTEETKKKESKPWFYFESLQREGKKRNKQKSDLLLLLLPNFPLFLEVFPFLL